MTIAFTFLAASRLWLLLLVLTLVAAYVALVVVRRRTYEMRFTNVALLDVVAPKRPAWRRHVTAVLFVAALGSLVVALARPSRDQQVPKEQATIIMAIDVSLSMDADDVEPNRLEAAKAAAHSFLDEVPDGINLGLVTFSGTTRLVVPPTTERDPLHQAVDDLQLSEGTAIGEAILTSVDAIEQFAAEKGPDGNRDGDDGFGSGTTPDGSDSTTGDEEEVPGRVVLMSDGETTVGRANTEGVAAALDAGVPISTIAFGTDEGEIQLDGDPIPVPVPVNRPALESIADDTGGQYFSAVTEGELAAIYRDIGSAIGFTIEQREIGTWFVGFGFLLLLAASAGSLLWFNRLP